MKVGSERICSDVFFSNYSASIKDNRSVISSPNITTAEIEIIEEQQNINNIIDDANNAILISNGNLGNPKVIVQEINQYQFTSFNQINFDENELSEIICLNDQDLIDDLFNYSHNEVEELI